MERAAFTLLELILVLAIMGMFSAVAAARLSGLRDGQGVELAARRTAMQAQRASHLAVMSAQPVRLRLDPEALTTEIRILDGNETVPSDGHPAGTSLRSGAETITAAFTRSDGMALPTGPVDLVFWPDARVDPVGTWNFGGTTRTATVHLPGGTRAPQVEVSHEP